MSLAKQVAAIEEENHRMKRAAHGNVLLLRRDGFSRSMLFHCPSYGFYGGDSLPYSIEACAAPRPKFYNSDEPVGPSGRIPIERYHRTSRTDEFGRVIYEEV